MSDIEDIFEFHLKAYNIEYEREFKLPGYRFRWDFKVQDVLIEIQGGVWVKSAHTTGQGITRDCRKINLATLNGYRTLQFTSEMVNNGTAIDTVLKLLKIG